MNTHILILIILAVCLPLFAQNKWVWQGKSNAPKRSGAKGRTFFGERIDYSYDGFNSRPYYPPPVPSYAGPHSPNYIPPYHPPPPPHLPLIHPPVGPVPFLPHNSYPPPPPPHPFPPRPPLPPLPPHSSLHPALLNDPTFFNSCKCVFAFNCGHPGILFGQCDYGKQYCCEKFSGGPNRGVLAGPGGPVDHLFRP